VFKNINLNHFINIFQKYIVWLFSSMDFTARLRGKSMSTITGTNGNDNGYSAPKLIGTNDADTINGLDGHDVIEGLGGADTINGGAGEDRVTYRNSTEGVVINLLTGTGAGGHAAGDTFTNIESIEGSAFADTLIGDAGVNGLSGHGGNDILEGGAGADIIDGGSGSSTTSYSSSPAGVTVNLATYSGVGGDAEGDEIWNTANITGSAHADLLTGDGNANILDGGAGNDTLTGAGGNDILRGGAGDDTAVFSGTRTNAAFTQSGTGITVISADGTDTLEAVEFFKFSDQTVSAESIFPTSSVDTTAPNAPTVSIAEDTDNDGLISGRESSNQVDVTIKLPTETLAGDTLTITSSDPTAPTQTVNLTDNHITAGVVLVDYDAPAHDGTITVSAVITDAAGNTSAAGSDSATLDLSAAASITLDTDITPDNIINAAEAGAIIAITGTTAGDVAEVDTVTLTVNNTLYTGLVTDDGSFSIDVAGSDLAADGDTKIDASVTTTDAAGNTATATDTAAYSVSNMNIKVTTIADIVDANDGVISLREAVTLANINGGQTTIELDTGIYGLTADHGGLEITGDVILRGVGISQTGILNLNNSDDRDNILHVQNGAVFALSNLTMGSVGLSFSPVTTETLRGGGALLNEGGSVMVNSVSFVGNQLNDTFIDGVAGLKWYFTHSPSSGGAIFNTAGRMDIVDSAFTGNIAGFGGALGASGGYVSVDTTSFDGNKVYADYLSEYDKSSSTGKREVGEGAAIYATGSAKIDVFSDKTGTGVPTTIRNHTTVKAFGDPTLVEGAIYLDPDIDILGNALQRLNGVTRKTPFGDPAASARSMALNVEAGAAAFEFEASSAAGVPALLTLLQGLDLSLANPDLALVVNSILSQSDVEITIQLAGNRIILSGTGLAFTGDPIALTAAELILAATGTIASITIQNKDGTATVGSLTGISASFKDVVTDLTTFNTDGSSRTLADAFTTIITQNGSAEVDALFGSEKADVINALAGDDVVTGKGGNDILDGGAGVDTAIYSGNQSSYTLTLSPTATSITDRRVDGNGMDQLIDIEFLDFDTEAFLFDFNLIQFGGATGLSESQFESFIELYIAYFNRAPDAVGLNYWGTAFANGTTHQEMATLFIDQDETRATYPTSLTNADFATAVYNNVLGRIPDQAGFDFWVGILESGARGRDQFILSVLNGVQDGSPDQAYLSNKIDIGAYFAVHKGMSDGDNASAAMALFDGTEASINNAVNAIDAFYANAIDADTGEFLMQVVGILDDPFTVA
jgi:CSLREA domain-containing protein